MKRNRVEGIELVGGKLRITFSFTEARYQRIRALAQAERVSMPEMVRRLVDRGSRARGCRVVAKSDRNLAKRGRA